MKKIIFIILLVSFIIRVNAQSLEFSVQAYSGMSHFTGNTTTHSTFLNTSATDPHAGYPNGTGNIYTPDLGIALQLQYNFKSGFLLGGQAAFEQFNNKVDINGVYEDQTYLAYQLAPGPEAATGHVTDHDNYVNLTPYIGYRFVLNKVKLDVMPGFDIAIGVGGSETVNVKANDGTYYNKPNIANGGIPPSDVRARIGLAAYYLRYGIIASYSRGLKDYNSGELSDSDLPPLHAELFRLGLSYRIR
jgi:hypothetical protein